MKKRAAKFLILCGMSLILTCQMAISAEKIHFIGLNDKGEQITKSLSKKIFKKRFSNIVNLFQDQVIQALDESEPKEVHVGDWEMKKFLVGTALSASIGLGDTVSATVKPSFYLIFKK